MNPVNHILVVEDDDGLRTLIADALAQDGHRVSQVGDGDRPWSCSPAKASN